MTGPARCTPTAQQRQDMPLEAGDGLLSARANCRSIDEVCSAARTSSAADRTNSSPHVILPHAPPVLRSETIDCTQRSQGVPLCIDAQRRSIIAWSIGFDVACRTHQGQQQPTGGGRQRADGDDNIERHAAAPPLPESLIADATQVCGEHRAALAAAITQANTVPASAGGQLCAVRSSKARLRSIDVKPKTTATMHAENSSASAQ